MAAGRYLHTAGQEILKDAVGLVLNDDGQTISLK